MKQSDLPVIDHSSVAEGINETTNYTIYAVFAERRTVAAPGPQAVEAIEARLRGIEGLTVRGWYDLSGFRADADLMLWAHAPTSGALQAAYRAVLEESAGRLEPVWSNIGVHRAAEFNKAHVPAFLADEQPRDNICVYPFVRSHEWYLLPDEERRAMLAEHGRMAGPYPDVRANTVSSFALGDYEWLLAFESDDLVRIVDLMRELRATEARRHVREEVPFFTGPRAEATTLLMRALA